VVTSALLASALAAAAAAVALEAFAHEGSPMEGLRGAEGDRAEPNPALPIACKWRVAMGAGGEAGTNGDGGPPSGDSSAAKPCPVSPAPRPRDIVGPSPSGGRSPDPEGRRRKLRLWLQSEWPARPRGDGVASDDRIRSSTPCDGKADCSGPPRPML
jgi:hypothetical protein